MTTKEVASWYTAAVLGLFELLSIAEERSLRPSEEEQFIRLRARRDFWQEALRSRGEWAENPFSFS